MVDSLSDSDFEDFLNAIKQPPSVSAEFMAQVEKEINREEYKEKFQSLLDMYGEEIKARVTETLRKIENL